MPKPRIIDKDDVTIYALIDPRNALPCYIGQTVHPKARLSCHLAWARSGNDKSAKADWIRELIASGEKPEMVILTKVPAAVANQTECAWINQAHRQGWPILN